MARSIAWAIRARSISTGTLMIEDALVAGTGSSARGGGSTAGFCEQAASSGSNQR
ncbi:hypothetical protein GGQ90_001194 [Sphingobium scionense]|uniref:Uncharacterized protein n=1 Tax=Sphingobium scionense TaxID=1404341 RepID=A0A7W6LN44_9SPHN|nr:hypothetical protein [Sphingobium scionense]